MMSVPSELVILSEIGIIIIIATFFGFLVRLFKQPLIPAYILTGILIGPLFLGLIENQQLVESLAYIGVAFLIFTAGLEIKFKKLKEVGKVSSIGGVLQIGILFIIAFLIALGLGFSGHAPVYIGLVVAFSSTMIVVKLLSDNREINSLHGRIIIGILLVQDIVAIAALAILSSDLSLNGILIILGKAGLFAIVAFLLSKIVNPLFKKSADNHELLLLVAISFLFLFIIGSFFAGLSLIIGAFFAGVSLANSDYKTEIQGRIAPLREFFSVIFFVALGMQLRLISREFVYLFLILFILVIILKPLVIMFLVRLFGYKKITSFLSGSALAQTSEFSLIIVTLGLSLGHIDQGLFSSLVLLTILTMSFTPYLMHHQKKLSRWLDWPLNSLNKFHSRSENLEYFGEDNKKVILFGCHRMGSLLLKNFEKGKKDFIVVDYNPEIIRSLMAKKIQCIYGDFVNEEVLDKVNVKNAEVVISTVPDFEDNLLLIDKVRRLNKEAIILIVAERISQALDLYKAGADYIIMPHIIGGQKTSDLIKKIQKSKSGLKEIKKEHIKYLNSIHHILY